MQLYPERFINRQGNTESLVFCTVATVLQWYRHYRHWLYYQFDAHAELVLAYANTKNSYSCLDTLLISCWKKCSILLISSSMWRFLTASSVLACTHAQFLRLTLDTWRPLILLKLLWPWEITRPTDGLSDGGGIGKIISMSCEESLEFLGLLFLLLVIRL